MNISMTPTITRTLNEKRVILSSTSIFESLRRLNTYVSLVVILSLGRRAVLCEFIHYHEAAILSYRPIKNVSTYQHGSRINWGRWQRRDQPVLNILPLGTRTLSAVCNEIQDNKYFRILLRGWRLSSDRNNSPRAFLLVHTTTFKIWRRHRAPVISIPRTVVSILRYITRKGTLLFPSECQLKRFIYRKRHGAAFQTIV